MVQCGLTGYHLIAKYRIGDSPDYSDQKKEKDNTAYDIEGQTIASSINDRSSESLTGICESSSEIVESHRSIC